jgi:hypothetical protein
MRVRKLALFILTAGAVALSAGTAAAAPKGPEGPDNCTFEKGTTTCHTTTTSVVPITQPGCSQDGSTTTTTTTYTAHKGTYNSNGKAVDAPAPVVGAPVVVAPSACALTFDSVCTTAGGTPVERHGPACLVDYVSDATVEVLRGFCSAYDSFDPNNPLAGGYIGHLFVNPRGEAALGVYCFVEYLSPIE